MKTVGVDEKQLDASKMPSQAQDQAFPVLKVRQILGAVETTTGASLGLLDALGVPSEFDSSGALRATGPKRVLSVPFLKEAQRSPRPVLHPSAAGGAAVSVPFTIGPSTGGFISAWGFSLAPLDDDQRGGVAARLAVDPAPETLQVRDGLPLLDFEKFSVLVDLLEAASAQITLLMTGALKHAIHGNISAPLSSAVFTALQELSDAGLTGDELTETIQARERLEAIYNSTQDAILMLDKNLKIVAANREFGTTFGTDAEAFIGVTGNWLRRWLIKNAKDPSHVSDVIDKLLGNLSVVLDDEIELLSPRHMILRFYSAPVTNKAGKNIGRLLVFRDITQFRKARHELIGTEKTSLIGRVAAGLAHELNNILAGMVTYADYALEEGDSEKIREALKMSISSAEKASALVQKFLSVAGPSESQRQEVDIHLELERLLDSVEAKFKASNIRIHRLLEAVPHVHVDPIQLQQVFHQILDNAGDAIGRDGTITVRTETDWDRGEVRVVISDSGPGIPAEYIDRVFDPFFTTKGVVSGGASTGSKGLGLSVAKGIVEAHGGKIYAGNILPHGASIVIELPRAGSQPERPPSPSIY